MAFFANNDQDTLLRDLLAKHVAKLKVPELKAACTEHQIVLEKKAIRASIVGAILGQKFSKLPGLMFQCLKGCSVANLKVLLKGKTLPVQGSKDISVLRLLQSLGAAISMRGLPGFGP